MSENGCLAIDCLSCTRENCPELAKGAEHLPTDRKKLWAKICRLERELAAKERELREAVEKERERCIECIEVTDEHLSDWKQDIIGRIQMEGG